MQYLVFDVETTGLTSSDEVVQFSGFLLNDNFNIQRIINFYCDTYVIVHPKARAVSGLDNGKIKELSGGKFFEDYWVDFDFPNFSDITWVGYNVLFDIGKINGTLKNNGMPTCNFGKTITRLSNKEGRYNFDLMQALAATRGGIPRKLVEESSGLNYTDAQLDVMYKKILRIANCPIDTTFHNSLYDTMITWMLLVQNKRRLL